jgi:SRSO17 transposase
VDTVLLPTGVVVELSEEICTLSGFCANVFNSLSRSDQRHWAGAYVAGLLYGEGKRTIRRMLGEHAPDRFAQSLQQIVSQSPWDPQPVLQAMSEHLSRTAQTVALTVDEVMFVKYGPHSAGVERQYSRLTGRVSNCQLGLAVCLVTEDGAVPIAWRLMLPPSWDTDQDRRRRARVPSAERHLPRWHHVIAAVDEVTDSWPVPAAPVVTDAVTDTQVALVLTAAESRGLRYAVEVRGDLRDLLHVPYLDAVHPSGGPVRSAPLPSSAPTTLAAIARLAEDRRQTATWRAPGGGVKRGQFIAVAVSPSCGTGQDRPRTAPRRVLVAEWPLNLREPRRYWLTNMVDRPLCELVPLVKLSLRSRAAMDDMQRHYGLCDYEGRSFVGWQHHVALASAAYAFPILEGRHRDGTFRPLADRLPDLGRSPVSARVQRSPAGRTA